MNYNPFISTEIQFMNKKELEDVLIRFTNMNLILILSESAATRFAFIDMVKRLEAQNNLTWIKELKNYPTQEDIIAACEKIENKNIDLIIAVGGGSAIDLAKGISTFYDSINNNHSVKTITESLKEKNYKNKNNFIDIIAIPTTAGTGSEITGWATVWDVSKKEKYSIDHVRLRPKRAIIVPELTLTLSRDLTLSTGLDALTHAVEAYWSKHTSPLVQDIAYRSIQLIVNNLRKVLDEPENLYGRECMCRASVLAAIAFSHTRTTACHSISYPLTMLYNVPHGYAVAMTLNEVAKRNKGKFPNDTELYEIFMPYGGIQTWLDNICKDIINLRLSGFGISKQDIEKIINNAFTAGRIDNNPAILTAEDVREILLNVFQ